MNGLGAALKERSTTPARTRRERRERERERTRRRREKKKKKRPHTYTTHTDERHDHNNNNNINHKKGEGSICCPDSFFGLFVSLNYLPHSSLIFSSFFFLLIVFHFKYLKKKGVIKYRNSSVLPDGRAAGVKETDLTAGGAGP